MPALRRSSRHHGKPDYSTDLRVSSYPDGPPANPLEAMIADLNREAFPSESYAAVDDLLVFSLFATKKCAKSYRALKPALVVSNLEITDEQGISIARECWKHISRSLPNRNECLRAARSLKKQFAEQFSRFNDRLITQYVLALLCDIVLTYTRVLLCQPSTSLCPVVLQPQPGLS